MPLLGSDLLEAMNASQHQRMLSGMMISGTAAESLAGGIMSRGAAVGAPLVSGAMGMMGLDPLTMGLRAGGAAYASGAFGLGGAAAIGMGVAAPLAIGGIAANYAGNQMMHGAQQQMGLNQGLRSGYNFINGQGGQGFTSQQGFQIGGQIRSMTHEVGPAGEMHGFEELSKIAGNMGRMGFAQNIRTVEDFRSKFKETMETLKKVAHDIGSTLEDAMKFVQSMKGSGIFRAADQLKMSGDIRTAAFSGGIATSEVSAMANIGSQISRSVGGLGRQGAFGGIKAIEQIGQAQRLGILSEEDVYNATGQSGAEGRQALAASQMQRSASFLRGGRGRRFLASIAGEDGQLNESSVAEWMQGGVSTGRTMEMAHKNLSGVGRANFIRNEGRLRGAALEQFGGMAQTMAYSQWLGSRGYDPSAMDDKAMLAFQRFSGMGRDEADAAIKQVQGLPQMLRERSESMRGVERADALQRRRETTGIAGLEKKIEHAKHSVNTVLEEAGSKILQTGQERIEKWFNEIMGIYVSSQTEGISELTRAAARGTGGASNAAAMRRMFGTGTRQEASALASGAGRSGLTEAQHSTWKGNQLLMGARNGSQDENVHAWAGANQDSIKEASLAAMGKTGQEALNAFQAALGSDASYLFGGNKGVEAQMGVMQAMQQDAGISSRHQIASLLSKQARAGADSGGGKYRTEAEMLRAQGNRAMGASAEDVKWREQRQGWQGMWGLTGKIDRFLGIGDEPEDDRAKSVGSLFQDKETLGLMSDLFQGSDKEAAAARSSIKDRLMDMHANAGEKGLGADQGKADYLAAMSISSEYGNGALLERAARGENVDLSSMTKRLRSMGKNGNLSEEEAIALLKGTRGAGLEQMYEKQEENQRVAIDEFRDTMGAENLQLQANGQATRGKDGRLHLVNGTTSDANELLGRAEELVNSSVYNRETYNEQVKGRQDINQRIAKMSTADRKILAREQAGNWLGESAAGSIASERQFNALTRRTGSEAGAVETLMGFNVDKEEKATLQGLKGDERTSYLSRKLGLNEAQRKEFTEVMGEKNTALKAERLKEFTSGLGDSAAGKALKERRENAKDPQVALLEKIQNAAQKQSDNTTDMVKRLWETNNYLMQLNEKAKKPEDK